MQLEQSEVDDAIEPAEGHGRLGTVAGQRFESRSLAAGENDCQYAPHELPRLSRSVAILHEGPGGGRG